MLKRVKYKIPKALVADILGQDALANRIVASVYKAAKKRGVKMPASMQISGSYDDDTSIAYTTNAIRDLIVTAVKRRQLERVDL